LVFFKKKVLDTLLRSSSDVTSRRSHLDNFTQSAVCDSRMFSGSISSQILQKPKKKGKRLDGKKEKKKKHVPA